MSLPNDVDFQFLRRTHGWSEARLYIDGYLCEEFILTHLINLISQVYAVEEFLADKSETDMLNWLKTKGELTALTKLSSEYSTVYKFRSHFELRSHIGFGCAFFIRNRQFIFLGDHTTFRPSL